MSPVFVVSLDGDNCPACGLASADHDLSTARDHVVSHLASTDLTVDEALIHAYGVLYAVAAFADNVLHQPASAAIAGEQSHVVYEAIQRRHAANTATLTLDEDDPTS